jgi:hypothetical protein
MKRVLKNKGGLIRGGLLYSYLTIMIQRTENNYGFLKKTKDTISNLIIVSFIEKN